MMLFLRWISALLSPPSRATRLSAKLTAPKPPPLITYDEYMMGRDVEYPPTPTLRLNACALLIQVNALLEELAVRYQMPFYGLRSGYRPGKYNAAAGGAKNSAHLTCEAVDLSDRGDQLLGKFLLTHEELLEKYGLYMEHPKHTKGKNAPWVHLQTRKTRSGKRVFIP